jgi:PAS domain S-box-containing protein
MRSVEDSALIATIAEELAAGIWVATVPDGRFVFANRAFEEIMGVAGLGEVAVGEYAEPYGIYGRDGQLYPESKMPFVRAVEARTTVVVDDLVIHRRDGRHVFVRAHAKPMFDAAGAMTHVAIAFFDITREASAEQARRDAEERLRGVVANAPIVLYAFDRDGVITFVEGKGLEGVGLAREALLGQSVFALFPDATPANESSRRALSGETVSFSFAVGDAAFEIWLAPKLDEAGAIAGCIGVAIDVTERRRIELQLAQAERLLSVGMLASGVAHEINNPLSYVMGNLDLIARRVASLQGIAPSDLLASLDAMVRDALHGADRVRAIVRDLRVFSRVTDRPATPLDLSVPLGAALDIARNEIRHRAHLVLDLAPVPPVLADEGRASQLFLNLLVNAAQAIPEGAAERNEIRVATRVDERGWATVEISDTGIGIPREVMRRIFDPFFTTKPVGVGTGLGLSISHAIVTELGGRIEVSSRPGLTTFRVLAPPAARAGDPPRVQVAPPAVAKRRRVLLIDDEPMILRVMSARLEAEHDVETELRADAALERILAGQRFDVILCDLMMPEMTGFELHERLLSIAADQARAMVFVTGGAFTDRARAFLASIPNPTLEKPFDMAALESVVRTAR